MDWLIDWVIDLIHWFIDLLIHGSIDPLYLQWRKSNPRNFLAKSSVNNALAHHPTHMPFIPSVGCNKHIISYHIPWISYAMNMPITMVFLGITPHLHIYIYPIIPYKKPSHLRQTGDPIPFHHVVSPGVWKISEGMMIILVGMMFTMKSKTPRVFQRNINWKGLQTCHN